jgi:hypothetical protein
MHMPSSAMVDLDAPFHRRRLCSCRLRHRLHHLHLRQRRRHHRHLLRHHRFCQMSLNPKPITINSNWVRYIRSRFSHKANDILEYLLERKKEVMEAPRNAQASNYSLPRTLWDKGPEGQGKGRQASPEQKMALFIRGMNLQHAAQPNAMTIVNELFCGKSFDDPENRVL